MNQSTTAAQKGSAFTRYGLIILGVIVLVAILLFLAGDFIYGQVRPAPPTITNPHDGVVVGANPPTFEGTTEANTTIKIYLNNKEFAARNSATQTLWSLTPEQQLEVGDYTMYVVAISPEGIKSKPSKTIAFTVPKRPQLTSLYDGQAFDEQPSFQGEAEAHVEVNLYIDEQYVESTRSDSQGKWSFLEIPTLTPGNHRVYVTAVRTIGEFGNKSEELSFQISSQVRLTR